MVYQKQLSLATKRHGEMHDITPEVSATVAESGIQCGTVNVFNIGSTGAIGTIEFEPGLQRDYPEMLDRLMPPSRDYGHEQTWNDGNGAFASAGDDARAIDYGSRRCWKTSAWDLAADLSSRMRHQTTSSRAGCDGDWGVMSQEKSFASTVALWIATGLGFGFSPLAPGTVGALWGIPLSIFGDGNSRLWMANSRFDLAVSDRYSNLHFGRDDAGEEGSRRSGLG